MIKVDNSTNIHFLVKSKNLCLSLQRLQRMHSQMAFIKVSPIRQSIFQFTMKSQETNSQRQSHTSIAESSMCQLLKKHTQICSGGNQKNPYISIVCQEQMPYFGSILLLIYLSFPLIFSQMQQRLCEEQCKHSCLILFLSQRNDGLKDRLENRKAPDHQRH